MVTVIVAAVVVAAVVVAVAEVLFSPIYKMLKPEAKPSFKCGLVLQWHITDKCNLRCSHCYQNTYNNNELSFDSLLNILDQYKALLQEWKNKNGYQSMGHITITGGEPFVRTDFLDLLEVFARDRSEYTFSILTNGGFIDNKTADKLQELRPSYIQVSLDGTKNTHDKIRGVGAFDAVISSIKLLRKKRLRTLISFTAHQSNYHEFTDVAYLGIKLGVSRVWVDRMIPCGSGSTLKSLDTRQTQELFDVMNVMRQKARDSWFGSTEIAMHRALQFLHAGGKPYSCSAGDTLITIMPNGDLYPCRRMPVNSGNVMRTPLAELYENNPLFQRLRNHQKISEGCHSCCYARLCRGGLKCLSHAIFGDAFKADPACWLVDKKT